MTTNKTTVALLFGGRSSEHGISCVTAAGVYNAIDTDKFEVLCVGITKQGDFVPVDPATLATYRLDAAALPEVTAGQERIIWPLSTTDHTLRVLDAAGQVRELGKIEVVLPMLHGPFGEDGTVQGMCELAGLPYVGSGVLGSALCMDKNAVKTVLLSAGVAVAPWQYVTRQQFATMSEQQLLDLVVDLPLPLFVKPSRAGSSVGVTKVKDLAQLRQAVAVALAEDTSALIEAAVVGREVEIGVLAGRDGEPDRTSSVIGEIVFNGREFYDFEAKYLGAAGADVVLPAEVTAAEFAALREAAVTAFRAAVCDVYARVDFFLTPEGPVLNEINTLPGFTPVSMFPQLWEHSGVSYRELITELLELAQQTVR
ncbi:D-alanine--D-alanine ligase family protein [Canibacter oris]|uniref:D-alanine--D-alanine ligase n=1 Tax=Canibacter oris TaxID=1365628 RepID=A0A840DN97_9MICO|nr:D-alanine--D-alanine ligase family protein [Canibacter oris]MBB4071009.1 D-alanine-D-alanine ligase [Canibacter oris]